MKALKKQAKSLTWMFYFFQGSPMCQWVLQAQDLAEISVYLKLKAGQASHLFNHSPSLLSE